MRKESKVGNRVSFTQLGDLFFRTSIIINFDIVFSPGIFFEFAASTRPENNCCRFLTFSGFFCCCALVLLVFVFMLLSILGVVINVIFKMTEMKDLMN